MVPVSRCCSNSIFQVAVGHLFGIFFLKFRLLKCTSAFFQIDHEQSNPQAFLYFTQTWALPRAPDIYYNPAVNQDHVWRSAIYGNQIDGAATSKIHEDEVALTEKPN